MTTTNSLHRKDIDVLLDRLYQRHRFGIKPGLDVTRKLLQRLQNPQDHMAIVHVAGTNGKGSVCAMIEAGLRASGFRTGLYTSPHLLRFNERIRINGLDIDDDCLLKHLTITEKEADALAKETGKAATFFEITTALAMLCFFNKNVQIAIVETGMGGRLDATNVVTPMVSVITRIAFDHEDYLGHTLEAIAAEKAGIIKTGRPVIIAPQDNAVIPVLKRTAIEKKSICLHAEDVVTLSRIRSDLGGHKVHAETKGGWSGSLTLPLPGQHQLENLTTALATLEQVCITLGVDLSFCKISNGMAALQWPGRFQIINTEPLMIADSAHNPSGAQVLAKTLLQNDIRKIILVTAMCRDKDIMGVIHALAPITHHAFTVTLQNERSLSADELASYYRTVSVESHPTSSLLEAMKQAIAKSRSEAIPIVVCGSIFLLGELFAIDARLFLA